MSEVHHNRDLRFHDNPHHKSNWCEICGLYYCWHDEAKEFDVYNHYQHDERAKGHKFIPSKKEFEEIYDDYFEDE